jgi:hypothetical protein
MFPFKQKPAPPLPSPRALRLSLQVHRLEHERMLARIYFLEEVLNLVDRRTDQSPTCRPQR